MNRKHLDFAILAVLVITVFAYDMRLLSIPSRVYMSVGRWTAPFPSQYLTLSNVSSSERIEIESYLRAGNVIYEHYIDVTGDLSPIRSWAESMFRNHHGSIIVGQYYPNVATFNIKLNEDEYYLVYLWQRKAYEPTGLEYVLGAILNVFVVATCAVFLYSCNKRRP